MKSPVLASTLALWPMRGTRLLPCVSDLPQTRMTQLTVPSDELVTTAGAVATPTRLSVMTQELRYAWNHSEQNVLLEWCGSVMGMFVALTQRRAKNLLKLVDRVLVAGAVEGGKALRAHRDKRLAEHLSGRGKSGYQALREYVRKSRDTTAALIQSLRDKPSTTGPQLFVLVVSSLMASGGVDGDGGAPDLDLMFGIDAHRSVLSHSILMGAALETAVLSLVSLLALVHQNLPPQHDPRWDQLLACSEGLGNAATRGASLGMAYHLLVDGLLQPAAYHGLPVSMPMEIHQAAFVTNGVAEAADMSHKARSSLSDVRDEVQDVTSRPVNSISATADRPASRLMAASEGVDAAKHRRALETRFDLDDVVFELTEQQAKILHRHGSWMEQLALGALVPLTAEQEHFVKVARGEVAASSPHEHAWLRLLELRTR